MSDELKPCPFCDGEAVINTDEDGCDAVVCLGCDASSNRYLPQYTERAIAAWNRRAQPERKMTDAEILAIAAKHGLGWATGGEVSPFSGDEDIAQDYLKFARAILAAQPAPDVPETNCGNIVAQPAAATVPDKSQPSTLLTTQQWHCLNNVAFMLEHRHEHGMADQIRAICEAADISAIAAQPQDDGEKQ